MALGYDQETRVFNLNDTASLRAFLYDENDHPISLDDALAVSFTVQKPDASQDEDLPGSIEEDGSGLLLYEGTDLAGEYVVVASFTTTEGTRSTRSDFQVIDPFKDPIYSDSYLIAVLAWHKFEDCFDAEDEGPWLRDMTLNYFNKDKMESFIDSALLDINLQNPPTSLTVTSFVLPPVAPDLNPTPTTDAQLLATGVMIQVIRHLMRSYTEQANPVGAQIAWQDRRDYLQRWQVVYQTEYAQYMRLLALWKRQFLGLGQARLLVASKAGRLVPAPMRSRVVGRGYW